MSFGWLGSDISINSLNSSTAFTCQGISQILQSQFDKEIHHYDIKKLLGITSLYIYIFWIRLKCSACLFVYSSSGFIENKLTSFWLVVEND